MLAEIWPSRMEKMKPAGTEEQDWTEIHGVNLKTEEGDIGAGFTDVSAQSVEPNLTTA